MLLPISCGGCGAPGWVMCAGCAAALRRPTALGRVRGVDSLAALLDYEGAARSLVAGLKYRHNRAPVGWLAPRLAALVADPPQVVTWVPTSRSRRRRRGFDHAELLALGVADVLDRPARALLCRLGDGAQTGRSRRDRLLGPTLAALADPPHHVLVVDDVLTTGTSLRAAAHRLRQRGARRVDAVVVAAVG